MAHPCWGLYYMAHLSRISALPSGASSNHLSALNRNKIDNVRGYIQLMVIVWIFNFYDKGTGDFY